LGEMAHDYYRHLAGQVDVNGTDSSERYEVEWLDDGGLRITVAPVGSEEGEPYHARRYKSDETGDIRLFLHGGDDIVDIR